jgi:tRNA threonylcarbamoyl adenosine modification protein YeaZ
LKILAFDVSVKGCGVAVFDSATGRFDAQYLETDKGQAEHLIPMIEDILHKNNVILKDIDRISTTRGPGSFTGVRIGLATARTLGLALSIPVLGFSTLDVLLKEFPDTLVAIDTKRDDYYTQTNGHTPVILDESAINQSGMTIVKDKNPNLELMCQLASEIDDQSLDQHPATPIYLRDAETSQPKQNKSVGK